MNVNLLEEDYIPYECFVCGIREDEEDSEDYDGSGIVFPSNSGEPTATESYLCHNCRFRIYE